MVNLEKRFTRDLKEECPFYTVMVENNGFMPTNNNMTIHFSTPEHIKTI
jgi:hypothetical protein